MKMSIGINNSLIYCYSNVVTQGELAHWLERKFLEWQLEKGRGRIEEFAVYLEISQPYLSLLMSGKRNTLGMKKALRIAEVTNDYTILDILGYSRPEPKPVPFSSLPPEFVKLLEEIDLEIEKTFRERGITEYSAEAESIAREIMEKYGANVISTKKSGNDSN